jgi:hypothetical protein
LRFTKISLPCLLVLLVLPNSPAKTNSLSDSYSQFLRTRPVQGNIQEYLDFQRKVLNSTLPKNLKGAFLEEVLHKSTQLLRQNKDQTQPQNQKKISAAAALYLATFESYLKTKPSMESAVRMIEPAVKDNPHSVFNRLAIEMVLLSFPEIKISP